MSNVARPRKALTLSAEPKYLEPAVHFQDRTVPLPVAAPAFFDLLFRLRPREAWCTLSRLLSVFCQVFPVGAVQCGHPAEVAPHDGGGVGVRATESIQPARSCGEEGTT